MYWVVEPGGIATENAAGEVDKDWYKWTLVELSVALVVGAIVKERKKRPDEMALTSVAEIGDHLMAAAH
ncbi:hypothetical protein Mgra_00001495 [Meloidogyne graminicola]|uniref:Uncharacterized protein n=1 Tax=Meloidogyne graminicola TaxID=189291 RepID=A0A8T0A0Y6_9BILA|nr:hypothetical protein Mgra_00001495 [Meloidogyne graminicola]